MTESKLHGIVSESLPKLAEAFGLDHDWDFLVVYDAPEDPQHMADCEQDVAYMKTILTLDPKRHDDKSDVLDTLRHELTHLLLTEFDVLYHAIRPSGRITPGEARLRMIAHERTVRKIEKLLDRIGMTPQQIMKRAA